jgi:magnesium transporter
VITVFAHRDGRTEKVAAIDRTWLKPQSGVVLWVDLAQPSVPESLVLSETFAFHPLSVEDAMNPIEYPKIEPYDGYLYIILHGIDFRAAEHGFRTHDVDFFVGPNYLVTVHDGASRSITELRDHCPRNSQILGEGPVALLHRIVDAMVDHYWPEVEKLEQRLNELEEQIFNDPTPSLVREILTEKRDVASLRRVITPQRDVVGRLARRDFAIIDSEMTFRFRDVYDQIVRVADDALIFHDRVTGMLDAHLSNVNNRLNEVMKLLTVVSVIFMPLTLLAGLYGMNVQLPHLPGGPDAQFWWLCVICLMVIAGMLVMFRRNRWL